MVRLATNYRSTPEIVAVTHAVLADGSGVERPKPVTPRPSGPAPTVRAFADDEAEAAAVAQSLRDAAHRGRSYSAMAVLYRTNAQSALFEQACARVGVPVRVRGSARFVDRPEVQAAFELLATTERAAPGRPISDHVADLLDAAREVDSDEERAHFEALARLAVEYAAIDGGRGTLRAFRAWLDSATRGDAVVASETVELCTFHAAKGLEWPVVFVTGVEHGLVPIGYARTAEARAEEQRLFHVALSRSETELHVTWARARGGRPRQPGAWLGVIEETLVGGRPGPAVTGKDRKARLAESKAALRAAKPDGVADVDLALFDALKEWRRQQARARDIPAFTIFHDATLREIAAARPHSEPALRTIHGVGEAKLERYGDDVLRLVDEHSR